MHSSRPCFAFFQYKYYCSQVTVWAPEPIAVMDLNSIFLDAKEFERGTALVSFQPLPIHYNHPIKSCSVLHTTLSPLS
jgi:hypothetical protein